MINCSVCKFKVSNEMRHALTKNMCPACGAALLGDFHMQRLNMIKEKIMGQGFSLDLKQSIIFDISLFIMTEFFQSSPNRASAAEEVYADAARNLGSPVSEDDYNLEIIREQVRRDAVLANKNKSPAAILSSEDDESLVDDDLDSFEDDSFEDTDAPIPRSEQDLKVAKLKRLYNESPTLIKSGVSVRRVI